MKKILLGMSGGVDSSAAAAILLQRGYDVTGATLLLERRGADIASEAAAVCDILGIKHVTIELYELFEREVIGYFISSYLRGETPNPCIVCNREVKFGAMLDYALDNGFDGIATGHYAQLAERDGRFYPVRPSGCRKEQTYVLYRLTQEQLSHTLFPLAGMNKEEIRAIAREAGMPCAEKHDSQDICFIPDGDYAGYITRETGCEPEAGDFVDESGACLGRHRGIIYYTVGQRKGLGISFGEPRFVLSKSKDDNRIVLGAESGLFKRSITARQVNWILPRPEKPFRAYAKTRYSQREQVATVTPLGDEMLGLCFDEPIRAAAAGQSAVVYDAEGYVLCGGIIADAR